MLLHASNLNELYLLNIENPSYYFVGSFICSNYPSFLQNLSNRLGSIQKQATD
jgi:hypothetical protein